MVSELWFEIICNNSVSLKITAEQLHKAPWNLFSFGLIVLLTKLLKGSSTSKSERHEFNHYVLRRSQLLITLDQCLCMLVLFKLKYSVADMAWNGE